MNIWIGRRLFQVVALPHAGAAVIVAHAKGTCALAPINTLSFTLYQSLAAFGLTPQAVYYICFSPAFIFDNLSRGPPAHLKGRFFKQESVLAKHSLRLLEPLTSGQLTLLFCRR